jgi:type I restriction enzyme, S subunit
MFNFGTVKIEDIAEVKSGKRLPQGHNLTDDITPYGYIRLVDISNGRIQKSNLQYLQKETWKSIKRYVVNTNDVCLAIVGHTIGMVFYVGVEWDNINLTENAARITNVNKSFNSRFIYYYLTSHKGQNEIISRKVGSAQGKLPLYNIKSLEIPNLPRKIQDLIVSSLDSLSFKIELNRQTNQTLEQMAQAIFKSWFVDFEPTRAKMAAIENGEDPERAAMAAISGNSLDELDQLSPDTQQQLRSTAALFPDKLVDSELGEIPEGWEVKSLSSIINLTGGGTPKRSEIAFWKGAIPWFSIKDIPVGSDIFVVDTAEKITQVGLSKSSTKLLPKGTTIISARGTVGKLALVATPMCMNQSCYGINGAEGIGPYFNYFNLREAISTLQRNTHGAVFDTITTQTFESYSMAIRIDELTKVFEEFVTPIMDRIENNVRESLKLCELRDSLLPKLLSGAIDMVEV